MTKTTARQRILAYLEAHPAATALEVARALQMTPANVRHHLGVLLADGRIQALGARYQPGARGRPQQTFGLSEARLGENFSRLAEILLDRRFSGLDAAAAQASLHFLAQQMLPAPVSKLSAPMSRRVAALTGQLSALGYQARWEARPAGPRIVLGHCPYAAIVERHPELCQMDALILENHLDLTVEQQARREKNESGWPVCIFSTQPK